MKLKTYLLAAAACIASTGMTAAPAQAQAEPFLGQLMLVPYNFCPRGWTAASGQILSIAQNTALFSLLGTTYGGNGQTTFALPDLRGRSAISVGTGPGLSPISLGQVGGTETVTLTINQMPIHNHVATLWGSRDGPDAERPNKGALATFPQGTLMYDRTQAPDREMAEGSVTTATAGGSQPFAIRDPYLALQYCIAIEGIFPSRN